MARWEQRPRRWALVLLHPCCEDFGCVATHPITKALPCSLLPVLARTPAPSSLQQHPPAFEWHIIMEYCDRGSFSRALAAMRFHEVGHERGQGTTGNAIPPAVSRRRAEAPRAAWVLAARTLGRCAGAGGHRLKELGVGY